MEATTQARDDQGAEDTQAARRRTESFRQLREFLTAAPSVVNARRDRATESSPHGYETPYIPALVKQQHAPD